MIVSETDERAFEKLIELSLVGSTREEREAEGVTDPEVQIPEPDKYYWGVPSDMDKVLALDVRRLWSFLNASQSEILTDYKGRDLARSVQKVAMVIAIVPMALRYTGQKWSQSVASPTTANWRFLKISQFIMRGTTITSRASPVTVMSVFFNQSFIYCVSEDMYVHILRK